MNLLVNRKLMIQFVLICIVIIFYDVALHSLFLMVHIAFEWLAGNGSRGCLRL